jgi:DHA2 family methylenomycin A resistance protein-like MFS transporter
MNSSIVSYASTVFGRSAQAGRHTALLFTTCLGVLVAQLDSSVVNLALKPIGQELGAGVSQLQWVVDSYNLVYATLLLTGGTLGDLYGRRRVFACGIALIAGGSLVCALAPSTAVLIAGRALTGLGAALELPTSLAILTVAYRDAKERGRAIGIWASCNGLALAAGPTVGGLLVDATGWRSIFVIVVPVTMLALLMAMKVVPETRSPHGRHLDPAGQGLAIVTLATLSFVAIEGPHWGFASPTILVLVFVCPAAAALFLTVERGKEGALVPLDMFQNRAFNAALAIAALMTFGMYALLFLTPLYLQTIGGYSAFAAGLALLPMSLTFVVVSQLSGRLARQVGARVMMTAGMACMGSGLLLLCLVSIEPNLLLIEVGLLVIGVGLGLNTGPVNAVAVASVPAGRAGTASGLVNTTRMVGATLGIAVLGSIFAVHAGERSPEVIATGLRLAYLGGAAAELVGAALALAFIRRDSMEQKA